MGSTLLWQADEAGAIPQERTVFPNSSLLLFVVEASCREIEVFQLRGTPPRMLALHGRQAVVDVVPDVDLKATLLPMNGIIVRFIKINERDEFGEQ